MCFSGGPPPAKKMYDGTGANPGSIAHDRAVHRAAVGELAGKAHRQTID